MKNTILGGGGGGYWPMIQRGINPLECWYPLGPAQADTYVGGIALAANRHYAISFAVPCDCNLDGVMLYVTAAVATSKARMGIYATGGFDNAYPTSLLLDCGEVNTNAVGVQTITGLTLPLYMGVLYAGTFISSHTPAITLRNYMYQGWAAVNTLGNSLRPMCYATQAYGALPATFSVVGTTFMTSGSYDYPTIFLRFT